MQEEECFVVGLIVFFFGCGCGVEVLYLFEMYFGVVECDKVYVGCFEVCGLENVGEIFVQVFFDQVLGFVWFVFEEYLVDVWVLIGQWFDEVEYGDYYW